MTTGSLPPAATRPWDRRIPARTLPRTITIAIQRELVNFPQPGDQLTGIDGDTRLIVGPCPEGQAPAAYPLVDDTANGSGSRADVVAGNAACGPTSVARPSWGTLKVRYGRCAKPAGAF